MTAQLMSRERLEEIVSDQMINQGSEFAMLARMALAAMDSEPVIVVGDDGGDALSYRRLIQSFEPGTKLYRHAQPATVIPDGYVMVPVPDEFLSAEQNASGMFELSEDCMCRLAVALSQQSKGLVTPPGYVMVPKEPTEDMCFAPDVRVGNKTWDGYQSSADMAECKAIYVAMLAAAPQEVKGE